jgi:hypothetical protein
MSLDTTEMKQRFRRMMVGDAILMVVAVGFAVAHFL